MVREVEVMIAAVIVSVGLMMLFARAIGEFVSQHPTIKMLALSFLVVVGVVLLADGFGHHVPKGYIYFAMAFSVIVEMLNIRLRKGTRNPVDLREAYVPESTPPGLKPHPAVALPQLRTACYDPAHETGGQAWTSCKYFRQWQQTSRAGRWSFPAARARHWDYVAPWPTPAATPAKRHN